MYTIHSHHITTRHTQTFVLRLFDDDGTNFRVIFWLSFALVILIVIAVMSASFNATVLGGLTTLVPITYVPIMTNLYSAVS